MDAHPTPPVTLVIFGATGDLTRRLLVPAIINLTRSRLVGTDLNILGVGIEPGDDKFLRQRLDAFLAHLEGEEASAKDEAWESLRSRISYLQGDFTKDDIFSKSASGLARLAMRPSISPYRRASSGRLSKNLPVSG